MTHKVDGLKGDEEENSRGKLIPLENKRAKNITCKQCSYKTTHKGTMKTHIEGKHNKIRRHVCEMCEYASYSKGNLNKHIKGVHGNIKEHFCEECGYASSKRITLRNHMLSLHNRGDKQYM